MNWWCGCSVVNAYNRNACDWPTTNERKFCSNSLFSRRLPYREANLNPHTFDHIPVSMQGQTEWTNVRKKQFTGNLAIGERVAGYKLQVKVLDTIATSASLSILACFGKVSKCHVVWKCLKMSAKQQTAYRWSYWCWFFFVLLVGHCKIRISLNFYCSLIIMLIIHYALNCVLPCTVFLYLPVFSLSVL